MCAIQTSGVQRVHKPLSLPKSRRILRSAEFREVYESGFRVTSRFFAAFCFQKNALPQQPSRIGFTLPRAIGKSVVRNRIRRRMREAASSHLSKLPSNWAVVFNPRRSALDAPFEELCRETGRIIERCNERS